MSKIFFTADLHFNHANIIRYSNRPFLRKSDLDNNGEWISDKVKFKRCKEMNRELIRRWNNVVSKDDVVYHVGDFAFGSNYKKFISKLNGNIVFFKGNHDNQLETCLKSAFLEFGGKVIFVRHEPPIQFQEMTLEQRIIENCDFMICGHVHDRWKYKVIYGKPIINVGVDVWNLKPVTSLEILKLYYKIVKNID